MGDVALLAAQQWASTNNQSGVDPLKFGTDVARVYLAANAVVHNASDEKATAAALAALSIPCEKLQWLEQLAERCLRSQEGQCPKCPVDGSGVNE